MDDASSQLGKARLSSKSVETALPPPPPLGGDSLCFLLSSVLTAAGFAFPKRQGRIHEEMTQQRCYASPATLFTGVTNKGSRVAGMRIWQT